MAEPLAYFITFTTYGTWLHGRAPGSVDREHNRPGTPFLEADSEFESTNRHRLRQEPYFLDEPKRRVVLRTIREVAAHRGWTLWAAHVRTNHVHLVVTANQRPEKVMADVKAWSSRRLREAFGESADRDRWTQHGSTRWLGSEDGLAAAVEYVVGCQGVEMACYARKADDEPEATDPDEPEA